MARKKTTKKKTTKKAPVKKTRARSSAAKKTNKKRTSSTARVRTRKRASKKSKPKFDVAVEIPIHTVKPEKAVAEEIDKTEDDTENQPQQESGGHSHNHNARVVKIGDKKPAVSGIVHDDLHTENTEEDTKPRERLKARESRVKTRIDTGVDESGNKWKTAGIIGLIVLVIGVVIAAFWYIFINQSQTFTGSGQILTIAGPSSTMSGAETTFTATLKNSEQVPLSDVSVNFDFPEGFTVSNIGPGSVDISGSQWKTSSIPAGASEKITITGVMIGKSGENKVINAALSYTPENVNSAFSEENQITTEITALKTDVTFDVPKSVTAGKEFDIEVTTSNSTDNDLENLQLMMVYPTDFDVNEAKPEATEKDNVFAIGDLEVKGSFKNRISGVLNGATSSKQKFKIILGFETPDGFIPQIEKEFTVKIGEVIAEVDTLVGGQAESALSPGETIEYKVQYKNQGTEAFKDVSIVTEIETELLDESTIEVQNGNRDGGTITWNKDQLENLETVNPGDEGELSFSVKILDTIPAFDREDTEFSIVARSFIEAKGTEGNENEEVTIEGASSVTKINTKLSLDAETHYYDPEGVKVGTGPLPPVKGEKTVYRVYLYVSNTTNEVDRTQIDFTFPDNVTPEEASAKVGSMSVQTGKVTWDIGRVPAHTGQFSEQIEAYIDVGIIPEEDSEEALPVFDSVRVIGVDSYTETEILKEPENKPTTDLQNDSFALEILSQILKTEANSEESSEEQVSENDS